MKNGRGIAPVFMRHPDENRDLVVYAETEEIPCQARDDGIIVSH